MKHYTPQYQIIIIYEFIVHIIAKFELGTKWEEMKELGLSINNFLPYLIENPWTYISLVLARLIVYILPALIFFIFTRIKKDRRYKSIKTFLKCLNLQFLGYLIYQGITIVLALDYLIELEPFANITIFMSMFGYVFTLTRNKEIEFGKINDIKF